MSSGNEAKEETWASQGKGRAGEEAEEGPAGVPRRKGGNLRSGREAVWGSTPGAREGWKHRNDIAKLKMTID